jgi:type IV pilus assembly protein PilC
MAVYTYIAKDKAGNKLAGTYNDIESAAVLRKELAKMGYVLIKARRDKAIPQRHRKIKQSEIVTFTYELAGMCSAGLSITKSLEALEQQTGNRAFKYILSDIRGSVETGSTLADAFEKHRYIFSDFFLGMLEAGESGGKLSQTLEMSASYLEKQLELKRKVMSAFAYPVIVGVMSFVIVTGLVVFVIPVFSKLYQQLRVPLPGPTQALIVLSTVVRQWWWAVLGVVGGVAFLVKQLFKDPHLRAGWDSFKLTMPVFAKLNRMVAVSRFIRTFAMLASAGVSLVKALDVASAVVRNSRVTEITGQLQESIEAGNSVADSLKEHSIFPPVIIQLVACGEEAGALSEMLNKGVDFLDKDIDRMISALLVKLEPAMTVIMGAIVGFLLMGVYLPMFDYMRHLK